MSAFEDLHWTPEDPEEEPYARVQLADGTEYLATRTSTELIRHMGNLAMYDFIYCQDDPDDFVIFKFTPGFDYLANYMLENDYPHNDFQTTVKAHLVMNYNAALDSMSVSDDFVPEDWVE